MDTVNATNEPGVALPDDTDMVTFCPFTLLAARKAMPSHNAQRITGMKRQPSRKSEFWVGVRFSMSVHPSIDHRQNPLELGLRPRLYFE